MIVIVMILIMIFGVYFRTKYDSKYVRPILKSNPELNNLTKICTGAIAVAIGLYLLGKHRLAFFILIVTLPFLLYLNFKTHYLARKRASKENKRRR